MCWSRLILALILAAAAASPLGKTVAIAPGVFMPTINLGTCCGSDPKVGLSPWLAAGGTGIDTAFDYQDQPDIAAILKAGHVDRSKLFITTKVPAGFGNSSDCDPDPQITVRYVQENLRELNITQVDLVLIHRPCQPANSSRGAASDPQASNNALWLGATEVLAMNLTRAIGVSNYKEDDLRALREPKPSVNQCSMSLQSWDSETINFCLENQIQYESFHGMKGCPFDNKDLISIAAAHKVSAAQVCLRWVLEKGCMIASGTGADPTKAAAYAKENLDIYGFQLTPEEMATLDKIHPQN